MSNFNNSKGIVKRTAQGPPVLSLLLWAEWWPLKTPHTPPVHWNGTVEDMESLKKKLIKQALGWTLIHSKQWPYKRWRLRHTKRNQGHRHRGAAWRDTTRWYPVAHESMRKVTRESTPLPCWLWTSRDQNYEKWVCVWTKPPGLKYISSQLNSESPTTPILLKQCLAMFTVQPPVSFLLLFWWILRWLEDSVHFEEKPGEGKCVWESQATSTFDWALAVTGESERHTKWVIHE